jgi:hypothetical protein
MNNESAKTNGVQRIYQNHSPKMVDDNPPPLPARGGAPLPMTNGATPPMVNGTTPTMMANGTTPVMANGAPPPMANGASGPNHGVIPFFPFHQFPGRSVKPNRKYFHLSKLFEYKFSYATISYSKSYKTNT